MHVGHAQFRRESAASLIFHPIPSIHSSSLPSFPTIFPSFQSRTKHKRPNSNFLCNPLPPPCIQTTRLGDPPLSKTRRKLGRGSKGARFDRQHRVPAPLCLRENEIMNIGGGGGEGRERWEERYCVAYWWILVPANNSFLRGATTWFNYRSSSGARY